MQKSVYKLSWLLPIMLHAADAEAWGLVTHVYFAHSLLWAMPLLDPRLQRAIKAFPELVMAGACLPDLGIVSKNFRGTHRWQHAHQLLNNAQNDQELAIAIGYASHLYVDVIAHNHFVPAHEAMWLENSMVTHIASEWAMDAHLAPLLDNTPGRLLCKHRAVLSAFIAPEFNCSQQQASQALSKLSFWDNVLRTVELPHMIYAVIKRLDKRVNQHFAYYIAKTQTAVNEIGIALSGTTPTWQAELLHMSAEQLSAWRLECLGDLSLLHPAPISYFSPTEPVHQRQ